MYVDDTNLAHWSSMPSCTPTELIAAAQTVTHAWGGLAIATGAAMKPENATPTSFHTGTIVGGKN